MTKSDARAPSLEYNEQPPEPWPHGIPPYDPYAEPMARLLAILTELPVTDT
jgi:hypothetical protein